MFFHLRISETEIQEIIETFRGLKQPTVRQLNIANSLEHRLRGVQEKVAKAVKNAPEGATHYRAISGRPYFYKLCNRTRGAVVMVWSFTQWIDTPLAATSLERMHHV